MVEGIEIGSRVVDGIGAKSHKENTNYGTDYLTNQFDDADLIVIEAGSGRKEAVDERWKKEEPYFTDRDSTDGTLYVKRFNAWAIYGNQVVNTKIFEKSIYLMKKEDKSPKVVWAYRKPYILNGVDYNERKKSRINRIISR